MSPTVKHRPESIVAAAIEVYAEDGVGASTATIAARAGVSNGTLFNYFPTKQGLIDAVYLSVKGEMYAAVGDLDQDECLETRFRQIWDGWRRWGTSRPHAYVVMNLLLQAGLASEEAVARASERSLGVIRVFEDAAASADLVDLPPPYLWSLFERQLSLVVTSALDDAEADLAFQVLWRGLGGAHDAGTHS